jgi:hypothetical protein
MTVYLNGTDISDYVQRDTISVNTTLNLYGNSGNAGQASMSFTLVLDSNNSIKPRCGNEVIFVGDDGYNRRYFGGIIVNISFRIVGFNETGQNVIEYQVDCRDLSILFDKAYVSPAGNIFDTTLASNGTFSIEQMIFDSIATKQGVFSQQVSTLGAVPQEIIGDSYGEFMDNLARLIDYRITIPSTNDDAVGVIFNQNMQVGRISVRQFIDQLAQEAGLTWWVDENFNFHHRSINSMTVNYADSYFNVTDDQNSLSYYGLELNEEFQNLASQALVTGNFYDAGALNIRNAIDGVQRWQEISIAVLNENAQNNVINRMYPGLAPAQLPPQFNTVVNPITGLPINVFNTNSRPAFGNGILTDPINSSLTYFEDTTQATTFLNQIGQNYLSVNVSPRFMGSVSFHDRIPYAGQSIRVRLSQLGIDTYMIITGINITASGDSNSGNDSLNRKYSYKVNFGDIDFADRFSRMYRNNNTLQIRQDRNIKPGIPGLYNYIYTQDNKDPLLILGVNLPFQNNITDKLGQPQPQTPPIFIPTIECRVTKDPLAAVNASNGQIFWQNFTKTTEIPLNFGNSNPTTFEQYEIQRLNVNSGVNYGWKITVPDAETLYFQVRVVSAAGEPSDWSYVRTIKKGESKDENDNPTPASPGALTGVSGQMDAGSAGAGLPCCPRTPVPSPAPGPSPSGPYQANIYHFGEVYVITTITTSLNELVNPYSDADLSVLNSNIDSRLLVFVNRDVTFEEEGLGYVKAPTSFSSPRGWVRLKATSSSPSVQGLYTSIKGQSVVFSGSIRIPYLTTFRSHESYYNITGTNCMRCNGNPVQVTVNPTPTSIIELPSKLLLYKYSITTNQVVTVSP